MVDGTGRSSVERVASVLALVAGLLVLAVVPAAAYWTVTAGGTGRRTLSAAATGGGLVAAAAIPGPGAAAGAALGPGGSVPVEVTVTNHGKVPAAAVEVRAAGVRVTPAGGATCPDAVFGFVAPPVRDRPVPAGGSVVLTGELRLAADAPPECQGAVVALDLVASSRGVSG